MTDKVLIDRSVLEQASKLLQALSVDDNYGYAGDFRYWKNYEPPEKLASTLRAALEQPQGEVVITTNQQGHCVAVTRQDEEGRILSVVWESKQPQVEQEPMAWKSIEAMAVQRYKVVPAHDSMFYRHAVVAGDGTQQLYIGRETECENIARKFAGAFLDGAYVALLYTHPQPKREPLSDEEVKAICYTGPVYAPDGKVTRTPEQYKREIADARMHGIRQAERAHGIVGE